MPLRGYRKPGRLTAQDKAQRYGPSNAARAAAWRLANPQRARKSERASRIKNKFGISEEQFTAMMHRQDGVCAICKKPPKSRRLAIEHDHITKRVRGLTCHFCNRYRIGNNTIETARRVLEYLESDFDGRNLVVSTKYPPIPQ